jgi:hypothetical protein
LLSTLNCCKEVSIVDTSDIFLPEVALSTAQPKFWYATTDIIAKIVITTSNSTKEKPFLFTLIFIYKN